ncbi:MAG: peptidoglycan editing factor PgeF [Alphaproteobacteria bacterium HGW-Alphaproteobacteria-12]|nr:MAG: peptidoglycan editing factor PgeF [Alphaproteobacteria bacterium HGW-Alphaproteobacteria-12]
MLKAKPFDVLSRVRHGFFTREGGVSKDIYASLNCGYGSNDDGECVRENRARVALKLGAEPEKLLTVYQVHSPEVAIVTEPWTPDAAPQADAMVTAEPRIALGILTADCAPVLFADEKAHVIGAAHAGWKGAIGGVLEETVDAMIRLGAERSRIVAAIGPCISKDAYEVGSDFRDRFMEANAGNDRWFARSPNEGHFMFDLPGYAEARLEAADIGTIAVIGHCTYRDTKRFFSYRRTTHRKEPDYGRQISAVMFRD